MTETQIVNDAERNSNRGARAGFTFAVDAHRHRAADYGADVHAMLRGAQAGWFAEHNIIRLYTRIAVRFARRSMGERD